MIHFPHPQVELYRNFKSIAKRLPRRLIAANDSAPIMTRYLLFGTFALPEDDNHDIEISSFLHEFHGPDSDRAMHNHPWDWSTSVVLSGCLTETRGYLHDRRFEPPMEIVNNEPSVVGDQNYYDRTVYHRITSVEPNTWTLFITGPSNGQWGFWVDGKHVPWQEYCK